MNHEYYMRFALEEAEISLKEGNWPIGCVIELNGEIIAKAHNQNYTLRDRLAHAEMRALMQVQQQLWDNPNQAALYTTYEPCLMCFGGIMVSRIKRVVSGIDLDNSGAMYLKDHLPLSFKQDKFNVDFISGVLAKECFRVFMASPLAKDLEEKGLLRKINPFEHNA
jgi:tRNA(adenine34) deaminase